MIISTNHTNQTAAGQKGLRLKMLCTKIACPAKSLSGDDEVHLAEWEVYRNAECCVLE